MFAEEGSWLVNLGHALEEAGQGHDFKPVWNSGGPTERPSHFAGREMKAQRGALAQLSREQRLWLPTHSVLHFWKPELGTLGYRHELLTLPPQLSGSVAANYRCASR